MHVVSPEPSLNGDIINLSILESIMNMDKIDLLISLSLSLSLSVIISRGLGYGAVPSMSLELVKIKSNNLPIKL